jgi:hypothetical protein
VSGSRPPHAAANFRAVGNRANAAAWRHVTKRPNPVHHAVRQLCTPPVALRCHTCLLTALPYNYFYVRYGSHPARTIELAALRHRPAGDCVHHTKKVGLIARLAGPFALAFDELRPLPERLSLLGSPKAQMGSSNAKGRQRCQSDHCNRGTTKVGSVCRPQIV